MERSSRCSIHMVHILQLYEQMKFGGLLHKKCKVSALNLQIPPLHLTYKHLIVNLLCGGGKFE
jgi:hypothetical protein